MKYSRILTVLIIFTFLINFPILTQVKTGADLLLSKFFHLIEGKRIGLVTNHTAVLSNGKHLADALSENKKVKLSVLFGPEHGVRGLAPAGEKIENFKDEKTGVPVYSLYGKINKPTQEMLKDVEVLIFDIQDVGVRFYTYESTMSLAMEAAAEQKIPFIVLDRPNPITGLKAEGYIREDSLASFVGLHPVPISHGLTIGELATAINELGWLKNGIKANLTVIKMEGWKRSMWYDETGVQWIKPSPNIKSVATTVVYPGTCLIEGTNISEGRGTEKPFEMIGAPYIDGKILAVELNSENIKGVVFEPVEFTPTDIINAAVNPKHKGVKCEGILVKVTDRNSFEPVKTGIFILSVTKKLYPTEFRWRERGIDRLAGTPRVRLAIDKGIPPQQIIEEWKGDVERWMRLREKYLLY